MARDETPRAGLLRRRNDRRTFASIAPPASFLSQMMVGESGSTSAPAEADLTHLALGAYATGSRIAIRRLPAGYRTSLDA